MMNKLRAGGLPAMVMAAVLLLAACGGTTSQAEEEGTEAPSTTAAVGAETGGGGSATDTDDGEAPAEEPVSEGAEGGGEQPVLPGSGAGSATLTVGGDTWSFDGALCAFGEEQTGQEGAEFVLSAIQNGLQLYASIDSYGHSVSINDIEDFENPSVSWEADQTMGQVTGTSEEFIELDGKLVSAQAPFIDYTGDGTTIVEGTLQAVCP